MEQILHILNKYQVTRIPLTTLQNFKFCGLDGHFQGKIENFFPKMCFDT